MRTSSYLLFSATFILALLTSPLTDACRIPPVSHILRDATWIAIVKVKKTGEEPGPSDSCIKRSFTKFKLQSQKLLQRKKKAKPSLKVSKERRLNICARKDVDKATKGPPACRITTREDLLVDKATLIAVHYRGFFIYYPMRLEKMVRSKLGR
jgi:hypothetical protein